MELGLSMHVIVRVSWARVALSLAQAIFPPHTVARGKFTNDELASRMAVPLVSVNCRRMHEPYLVSVNRCLTDGALSGRKLDLLDQRRAVAHPRYGRLIGVPLLHKQSQNARKTAEAKCILQCG